MKVLVETSVWSMALRKNQPHDVNILNELKELIKELRVIVIGPVRQELLSGISSEDKFKQLREHLGLFDDLPLNTEYFEFAAQLSNTCRKYGIQGSHTDFLICSVAINNSFSIFTVDKDFNKYKKYIEIKLHAIRKELI